MRSIIRAAAIVAAVLAGLAVADNVYFGTSTTVEASDVRVASNSVTAHTIALRTGTERARDDSWRSAPEQFIIAFRCSSQTGLTCADSVFATVYAIIDGDEYHLGDDSVSVLVQEDVNGWYSGCEIVHTVAESIDVRVHNYASDSTDYDLKLRPRVLYTTDGAASQHGLQIGD